MNTRTLFLFALACGATVLPAQINSPKAGVMRYADGTVHAVYGIPANYVVGTDVLASADAISFSDFGGLTAKNGRILLLDAGFKTVAEYDSAETAPLLNIDGELKTAIAWLPSRRALLHWNGTSLVLTQVNGAAALAAATSVRLAAANAAKLLATNADGSVSEATVSLDSGELTSLDLLPGVRGPAVFQQSFVVFRSADGLAIANSSAVLRTLPFTSPGLTFERMSSKDWHISSPSTMQNFILHVGDFAAAQLFQLPEKPAAILPASSTMQEARQ